MSTDTDNRELKAFLVVVNHEEQYSVWPVDDALPVGWKDAGIRGNREVCLDYIKSVWTDMRPLSLRQRMEGNKQN
jgi:MbtH protein